MMAIRETVNIFVFVFVCVCVCVLCAHLLNAKGQWGIGKDSGTSWMCLLHGFHTTCFYATRNLGNVCCRSINQ